MKVTKIDIGETVQCDFCSADFTDSSETGGFLFGTYGTCPHCVGRMMKTIERCNETHLIRERAREGETFRAFIKRVRGGNNTIVMTGVRRD